MSPGLLELMLSAALMAAPQGATPQGTSLAPAPEGTAPSPAQLARELTASERAKSIAQIAAMKALYRGPYSGVSWYCKDGTVLPPRSYACVEHGGGFQYGVLSWDAQELGRLGIHVGTVLTSLTAPALADNDYYRARAYVVESYLERALDGWVLKSAKNYRGFRQMEDEQENARQLLIELARKREVFVERRSLLMRLLRAMPYGRQGSLADEVRTLAGLIGDADPGFDRLRFKIHAMPEPADILAVDAYCKGRTGELRDLAAELATKMRSYYDPGARVERLRQVRGWIWHNGCKEAIQRFVQVDPADALATLTEGARLIEVAAGLLAPGENAIRGERNLLLLHAMALVEELWIGLTAPLARMPMSRTQALDVTEVLIESAGHLGLLSAREAQAAAGSVAQARRGQAADYALAIDDLSRALEWGRARVIADLGLALNRYEGVEPRARGVVDDVLRSGVMLPLATLLDRLNADAQAIRGGGHRVVGLAGSTAGLRGENSGFAVGSLAVLKPGDDPKTLRRDQIALLHELPPELPPVAGILTVGPAGSLSHVSLLARNLGIPHAAVGGPLAEALSSFQGQQIVIGVSAGRRVLLGPLAALPDDERRSLERPALPTKPFLTLDQKRLDLDTTRVLRLDEVSPADSGARVGPKAAELGRLKALFPDRVSDAAVIPFGAFVRHVDRPGPGGEPSPLARLRAAYAALEGQPDDAIEAALLPELERFRQAIEEVPFAPGFTDELDAALARLGEPETFGVFVRSDTNVEDLEAFTGAGLNQTIPNVTRRASILAGIRKVWASPYSERSFRWRQRILTNPAWVFPSVILHVTVPSEISGVMVTADIEGRVKGALTVSASEGVAAVVDGGSPETVVSTPDGGARLVSSPRSPTRKLIRRPPAEGLVVLPSTQRDPLLGQAEIEDLHTLAASVAEKIPASGSSTVERALPWDIEFGFYQGQAWLLQIRPLRTARLAATHPRLVDLDRSVAASATHVDLSGALP